MYKILETNNIEELEELVSKYLNEGWILAGGVSVNEMGGGNTYYAQAITKRGKVE